MKEMTLKEKEYNSFKEFCDNYGFDRVEAYNTSHIYEKTVEHKEYTKEVRVILDRKGTYVEMYIVFTLKIPYTLQLSCDNLDAEDVLRAFKKNDFVISKNEITAMMLDKLSRAHRRAVRR